MSAMSSPNHLYLGIVAPDTVLEKLYGPVCMILSLVLWSENVAWFVHLLACLTKFCCTKMICCLELKKFTLLTALLISP